MRSAPRTLDDRTTRWSSPSFTDTKASATPRFGYWPTPMTHEQLLVGAVDLAGAVDVEVVAVVEVAVRGADVAHRLRDLVDRVVVEGGEHVGAPTSPAVAGGRSPVGGRSARSVPPPAGDAGGPAGRPATIGPRLCCDPDRVGDQREREPIRRRPGRAHEVVRPSVHRRGVGRAVLVVRLRRPLAVHRRAGGPHARGPGGRHRPCRGRRPRGPGPRSVAAHDPDRAGRGAARAAEADPRARRRSSPS